MQSKSVLWDADAETDIIVLKRIYLLFLFLQERNQIPEFGATGAAEKPSAADPVFLFIVASAPLLLLICFSIFSLLSVNSPTTFTFILMFFYHIHAFTPIHETSSAGEEQEPFSPMSHRHANGEVIQPVFVDAAAPAPPGPSLLCACVS